MSEVDLVVIVWYRADEYAAVRALASDADRMEKTFQEWKLFADEALKSVEASGKAVRKVDFDNAAFMRWARARNVDSTYQTRTQFCVELASRN